VSPFFGCGHWPRYEIFDRYEKAALEARNQAAAKITQSYLNAATASKKGRKKEKDAK
jgi:hypothetical protein